MSATGEQGSSTGFSVYYNSVKKASDLVFKIVEKIRLKPKFVLFLLEWGNAWSGCSATEGHKALFPAWSWFILTQMSVKSDIMHLDILYDKS